jgi:hypothetical protein
MTRDQINKTNMYQATNLVLTASQSVWSGLAAFVRGQASLAGSINILNALAQSQGAALTGIALDKERLKLSLINRVLIVAGAAGSFAFESGNNTLAAKFDAKEGALKNMRDSLLDDAAQALHDEAAALVTANAAKMAEYNLTPAMLTDLQSAITAYSGTLGAPRAAVASRSAVTAAIAAEIERADANLANILDRLIVQFEADNQAFSTAYATARKIVDAGGSHDAKPAPAPAPTPNP